jgi:ABC-type multidrug transport system fused ATPase/permease subunit
LYGLKELNLTLIIIAHRITTLENCDLIFEMDKGSVKETLTYKELFAR